MDRSGQELVEFLAAVSTLPDDALIDQHTIEHAATAIGAEVAALVRSGSVLVSVGFPAGMAPADELARIAAGEAEGLDVPGAGHCRAARATLGDGRGTWLVVARAGDNGFEPGELMVLRGLAQVHALTSESRERQRLLLRLSRIQRSISHGSDLHDVLDAVVVGAGELLAESMVAIRLARPGDDRIHVVAATGLAPEAHLREPVASGEGAGGRAFAEERLVLMDDYAKDGGMGVFVEHGIVAAMAAPVYDDGRLAGALTVASTVPGHVYSTAEQEMLLAFAEHASLALTDARRINARHAQVVREAEDRFRALVENSTDVITVVGDDLLIEYQAPSVERALGYTPEELRGSSWLDLVHPDERAHVAAEIGAAVAAEDAVVECRMRAADGSWIHSETLVHDLHDDAAVGGVVLTTRDVSERVRAAEALREQQRYLQGILDNTPAGIYVKSPDGRFLLVNSECEKFCGLSRDEIVGRLDSEIFPADIAAESRRQDEEVLRAGSVMQWDEEIERPDGQHEYFTVKFPLFDAAGDPYAICLIASDVTERRRLERDLNQAQRLETVGRLAGGVAHDFNNLLSVIQGHAGFLLEDLPDGSPLVEDATAIRGAAQRAAALTQELLVFAGRESVSQEPLDLNEIVLDAERLLNRTIGDHINLETLLEARLPAVHASAVQLQQVLVNLVVNARDALADGGTVQIRTDSVTLDQPPAGSPRPGHHVRLVVSDDGEGMPPEIASRALEPFYTTKARGKGSGLGLSTVYGIVTQADGHLDIVTAPGEGTSVTILLPALATRGKGAPRVEPPPATAASGRGTVLLVEDEPGVRAVAARVLSGAGYRVLPAEEGRAALSLFGRHERDIDLLLTDVVMPGMSGSDLAAQLRARRPDLPVAFMSGYADGEGPDLDCTGVALLAKPFESHELLSHVGTALDGAAR